MDPFWGVSPRRWPGPSQPIRGWCLNQLWSVPEAPRLWEHQDRAYHRHVLSIKVTDGFTVQWVTGWLGGGGSSLVGTQIKNCVNSCCLNKADDSAVLCSAGVCLLFITDVTPWILKQFCLFCQRWHDDYSAWQWRWLLYLHLPSGQTPQSPSLSHQHHLTSPTMKASTSYFSSWCSVPEHLWNQGHTWA